MVIYPTHAVYYYSNIVLITGTQLYNQCPPPETPCTLCEALWTTMDILLLFIRGDEWEAAKIAPWYLACCSAYILYFMIVNMYEDI